jgi:UDP-N-acetylglucosamine:LPS N-acetylglucosamine transferase
LNSTKPTILLLTALTGGGHLSLAMALQDILGEDYETHIVDPQPSIFRQYYTFAGRHSLRLWGLAYKYSDNEKAALRVHKTLTLLFQQRLHTLIERIKPQLIITTHTLLSYEITHVLVQRRASIPLVFQFSELEEVHATWLTVKNADTYLVPTREIFAQAQSQGIDESRLHLTGMPVRKQFLQEYKTSRTETLAGLDLDPAVFTVFLQGGAEGAAGLASTVQSILTVDSPVQIILAVGTNKQLAARFSGTTRLRVLPFTPTIAPYMATADVVIGKAGPNFIAEAMMLEKPFLATSFIPGQEAPNLAFLERNNLGWVCLEPAAQHDRIAELASDPAVLAEKVNSIRLYRAWNMQANQNTYPVITGLISRTTQNLSRS